MAHIKCRYTKPMCTLGNTAEWDDRWWCDDNSLCCDYQKPEKPVVINGHILANPKCIYSFEHHAEFEKNYKEYELDEDGLSLGRRGDFMPKTIIEYLEIDGRILINEEVSE